MAWDGWHSSLLSIRAGAIENMFALPFCLRGKAHRAQCKGSSVQLPLPASIGSQGCAVPCTGTLWASLNLIHYHFFRVSSCPFLEFKLHF